MLDSIESLDRSLFLTLNQSHTPMWDSIMWYISTIVLWIPLFLFFAYYAYKKGKLKFLLIIIIGIVLCILLADRLSVMAFKNVFERYRPTHNLEIRDFVKTVFKPNGEEYRGGMYGFVSSHAANFFAIATFLFFSFRSFSKLWVLLFLWAAIIGYSRIYLGVHYPLDILGGTILGFCIGFVTFKLSNKIKYERT